MTFPMAAFEPARCFSTIPYDDGRLRCVLDLGHEGNHQSAGIAWRIQDGSHRIGHERILIERVDP